MRTYFTITREASGRVVETIGPKAWGGPWFVHEVEKAAYATVRANAALDTRGGHDFMRRAAIMARGLDVASEAVRRDASLGRKASLTEAFCDHRLTVEFERR